MADPLPKKLSGAEPFSQRKTLFLESPGIAGILVDLAGKRRRSRPMKFSGPHAALNWCIQEHAGLVFYYNADPSKN
jgi:hypothetical protein